MSIQLQFETKLIRDAAPRSVMAFVHSLDENRHFVIDASGHFLKEEFDFEVITNQNELMEFIAENKCEAVEDEANEKVLCMIVDAAKAIRASTIDVLKAYLDTVPKQEIEALQHGAVADIWYDAADHNDKEAQKVIKETQDAMSIISDFLTN